MANYRLNKYLNFLEALKDEISPIQSKYIRKWNSKKYLDYDVPSKTDAIKEGKWKLNEKDRFNVLSDFFSVDYELLETEIKKIPYEFGIALYESIEDDKIKSIFSNFNVNNPSNTQIVTFFSPNFNLISSKETESDKKVLKDDDGKPVLDANNKIQYIWKEAGEIVYTKNKGNLQKFQESWNLAYPNNRVNVPIGGLSNINSTTVERKQISDFNIFNNDDMFLYITSKPSDTLNMSASKFYTSCQDLYRETSYNDQIVANVFDKNSKVCYIIFDTPYYLTDNYEDEKQKVSEFLPICRNIIRLVKDSLYFDKTYPQRMAKVIERLITDYTGMTNEEDNSTIY